MPLSHHHRFFHRLFFCIIALLFLILSGTLFPESSHAAQTVDITTCQVLGQASTIYVLENDVTSNGTCFSIQAANVTLNLNGYTVTYGNGPAIPVPNGSFESGSGTNVPDWDLSEAPNAQRITGTFTDPDQVFDGSASMEFSLPGSPQMITMTNPITIPAGRTYVASAEAGADNSYGNGWTGDSVNHILEIIEASTSDVLASSSFTNNERDGFDALYAFYTPATTSSIYLAVGVGGNSASWTGNTYFDDIQMLEGASHGVMVAACWAPDDYGHNPISLESDLPCGGSSNNATIENGTINQGAGNGLDSGGIEFYQSNATGAQIFNINSTAYGPDTINIFMQYQGNDSIHNNTLVNNSVIDSDRDEQRIDSIYVDGPTNGDLIYDNALSGSDQLGITVHQSGGANATQIYGNTVSDDSHYTNDFNIFAGGNVDAYDNTVNPVQGRGIFLGDGIGQVVHDNTVTVIEQASNQEYSGCEVGGAYGIQFDDAPTDATAYNNTVVAKADQCNGVGLRVTDSETATNVSRDNSYTAERVGASTADAFGFEADGPTAFTSEDDTFSGDTASLGFSQAGASDVTFTHPTLEEGSNPSGYITFWFQDCNGCNNPVSNLHIIDPIFGSGASVTSTNLVAQDANPSPGADEYFIDWTYGLTVEDSSGNPLAGASVSLTNASGTTVFSGTTNAQGEAASVVNGLHVYNTTTQVIDANPNPYTVAVAASSYTPTSWNATVSGTTNQIVMLNTSAAGTVTTSSSTVPASTTTSTPQTLSVSLSASPPSGTGSLTTSLHAVTSGTAQGTVTYVFYCNRSDAGTNITNPTSLTESGISPTSYTATNLCTYSSPGTYTVKVIVEQGSAPPAEAETTVSVQTSSSGGGSSPSSGGGSSGSVSPPAPTGPAPVIGVKSSGVTATTAQITVTSNIAASVIADYGVTTAYQYSTAPASPSLTTVYLNLTNLSPNTVYDYRIVATGASGGIAYSPNYAFRTPAASASSSASSAGTTGSGASSLSASSSASSSLAFPRTLTIGDTGNDVHLLQQTLESLGFLTTSLTPTYYYGSLTEHAMLLFQHAHQVNESGNLDIQSQALMNKIVGAGTPSATSTPTLALPPATPPVAAPAQATSLTRTLSLGSEGADVTLLQEMLFQDGVYPQDLVTGYYGSLTETAVQTFQAMYGIVSYGSPQTTGYGTVGPKTRAALEEVGE